MSPKGYAGVLGHGNLLYQILVYDGRLLRPQNQLIRTIHLAQHCNRNKGQGEIVETISFDDFLKVELRVGRIVSASVFKEARKPAYVLQVDFGEELGVRKSSAQITALYQPEELVGKLVVAVINFPRKQIGPLMSECLVTGFHNEQGEVALCVPDKSVPLGTRLL